MHQSLLCCASHHIPSGHHPRAVQVAVVMSPAAVGWVQDMHPAGQTAGQLHLCWLWSVGARAVLHLQFALIPNLHCILGDLAGGFYFPESLS